MSVCVCSLAGTAACKYCACNPNAEVPPTVCTFTTSTASAPKDYPFFKMRDEKPPTNADRIRAMTDEEMAAYMGDVQTWGGCPNHGARNCTENCADCWLDWLKQEVGDDA